MIDRQKITFNAIKVVGESKREQYCFSANYKELLSFISIDVLERDIDLNLSGFQRTEQKSHISQISKYLENEDAILPNAIVLALDKKLSTFTPYKQQNSGMGEIGELNIHYDENIGKASVIDGQQRLMALKKSKRDNFPIFVTAISDDDKNFHAEQFINVNSTKPLPQSLINQLLPTIGNVPIKYQTKILPSVITDALATRNSSPFYKMIKLYNTKYPEGFDPVVEYNSVMTSVQNLTTKKGSFIEKQIQNESEEGIEKIIKYFEIFWIEVKKQFPEAWGKKPINSRLMHGTGIWAMFQLSEKIANEHNSLINNELIASELEAIVNYMSWTIEDEYWRNFDGLGKDITWNDMQNTQQDKARLSAFIIRKWRINRNES